MKSFLLKTIIAFCLFFLIKACNTQTYEQNSNLEIFFDKTEIQSIYNLVYFFEDYIDSNTDSIESFSDKYRCFFEMLDKTESFDKRFDGIFDTVQTKDIFIYETLGDDLIKDIWLKSSISNKYKYNTSGKYFEFIEQMSKNYDFISKYKTNIKRSGNIGPQEISDFMHSYYLLADFEDKDLRIIFVIHYFSIL